MKKYTLLFAILFSAYFGFGQANLVVEAPLNNNTNGVNRGPNGTINHTYLRACYLVLQSELFNIPSGTNITTFGFTLTTVTQPEKCTQTGNFTRFTFRTLRISVIKKEQYMPQRSRA